MSAILVIGSNGFIGSHICRNLSKQHEIIGIDKNLNTSQKIENKQIVEYEIDISNEDSVTEIANMFESSHIKLDGIVFAAGVDAKVSNNSLTNNFLGPENLSLAQWNFEIQNGLTAVFIVMKYFIRLLNTNSSIIILASDLSIISPDHRIYNENDLVNFKPISYSAIKTALVGMVRYYANFLAPKNIRVNCVSPGGIYNFQEDTFISKISQLIPLGRLAKIEEIVSVIDFLLSNKSSYMTGQNIVVDGGRTII